MRVKFFYLVMALALVFALVPVMAPSQATPVAASPTTYYVSVDGNNANSGLGPEPENAWRDIQYAIGEVDPGDTIIVLPGTYYEHLLITKSLTLKSSTGDWHDVDLDKPNGHGIEISGPGHVTVQGIEIHDYSQDGIHIHNIQHGGSVTILHCFIHHNWGAGIYGDDLDGLLHIEGNIIAHNRTGPCGVELWDVGSETTGGTVVMTDNVIGGWSVEGYYSGNYDDGIYIEHKAALGQRTS